MTPTEAGDVNTGSVVVEGQSDLGEDLKDTDYAFEKAVSRTTARAEHGNVVRLYQHDDGRLSTYEELCNELVAEAEHLDPEQWIDGYFNVGEYVAEACLTGLYMPVDVITEVVDSVTGETVVRYIGDDDAIVAERKVVDA